MSAHLAACLGLYKAECFACNCIPCLLSLSVNGTQHDRVVLINGDCAETRPGLLLLWIRSSPYRLSGNHFEWVSMLRAVSPPPHPPTPRVLHLSHKHCRL